jgi:galactose oxidase
MANLGNVWHIPANPEPRNRAGMRDPVFPTTSASVVTITTGNEFQGGGNPGNQLQVGSSLLFRRTTDAVWTTVPLIFLTAIGNNKYFSAPIPTQAFQAGIIVHYYLRIAYDDHDTTFVQSSADGRTSVTTADEQAAQAAPFTFMLETNDVRGEWGPVFQLPNVGIHAHVLPTGLVLMWGRRDSPDQSLDVDPPSPIHVGAAPAPPAQCTPFLWDPSSGQVTMTPQPTLGDPAGTKANLFCGGHAVLPDGRLLVAGGHRADGAGLEQTSVYDPASNTWAPNSVMRHGRWYPTLSTLPDGSVLILSGSFRGPGGGAVNNTAPEVWSGGRLTEIVDSPAGAFDLYPRVHVASSGLVITTGSLAQTWSLDISGGGHWNPLPTQRDNAQRDYAPSVLYDVDKVIYIGGGNAPTANAELLDLGQAKPAWEATAPMTFPRRQHSATILADGTVMVTGGTRSGGSGAPQDFNNLDPGQPIHVAELWDPSSGRWTQLAAEEIDRCYHSTAVLLPDGRVLSAGGGEFFPIEAVKEENDPLDSHRDAQVFSPPYLFKGSRPVISSAPDTAGYGETFHVVTPDAQRIAKVNWIRLSSVTHSFNTGQRLNSLGFLIAVDGLDVTAPASANVCPPGHYMMFLINHSGVPSVAKVMQVSGAAAAVAAVAQPKVLTVSAPPPQAVAPRDAFAQHDAVWSEATGTKVVIGLTGTCPYGIAACWGGANEALRSLDGVQWIDPIPDPEDSTATVFLVDHRLPPLDQWREQFRRIVNESYVLRGVEVTLMGTVTAREELFLEEDAERPAVRLAPLNPADKVQVDRATRTPQAAMPSEAAAYASLATAVGDGSAATVTVTGPLTQAGADYTLEVRVVEH